MKLLKKIVPYTVKRKIINSIIRIELFSNYLYDFKRFLKHSSKLNDNSELKLEAKITENYHVLEKGLGMVNRKENFGVDKARNLVGYLHRYLEAGYPADKSQIITSVIVLKKYLESQKKNPEIKGLIKKSKSIIEIVRDEEEFKGGAVEVSKESIVKNSQKDFKSLLYNRHSIRNFSSEEVDIDILNDSILMAQRAPSACNRQSSKVYILKDKQLIERALSVQNGNRGFGNLFDKLLIVTADINAFKGPNERNQTFIDGGIFAASLLYSLQFNGLGACALNWSVVKKKDIELREKIKINESENIIMMIGVGNLPDENFNVAASQRKRIEEIVKYF